MDKPRISSLNQIQGRGNVCELGEGAGSSLLAAEEAPDVGERSEL